MKLSTPLQYLQFTVIFVFCIFFTNLLLSQNLDVDGKVKISDMDQDNLEEDVVVRQNDGTLATRPISSINGLPQTYIDIVSTDHAFLDNNDSLIIENFNFAAGANRVIIVHFQGTQNPGLDSVKFNNVPLIKYPSNQRTFYLTLDDSEGSVTGNIEILLHSDAIGFALIACLTGVDPLCPLGAALTSEMQVGTEVSNVLNSGYGNIMLGFTVAADLDAVCQLPTLSSVTSEQIIHINESTTLTGALSACATIGLASRSYTKRGNAEISWLATNSNPVVGDFNSVVVNRADNPMTKYAIGDSIEGGIIFYLDHSGNHGLMCTSQDVGNTIWWNGVSRKVNANGELLFDGYMNTMLIISQLTADDPFGSFAAKDATVPNFDPNIGGWHLPSLKELQMIHDNLHTMNLGNFSTGVNYWSSTEIDADNAKSFDFGNNSENAEIKSTSNNVRPIRRF